MAHIVNCEKEVGRKTQARLVLDTSVFTLNNLTLTVLSMGYDIVQIFVHILDWMKGDFEKTQVGSNKVLKQDY